MIPDSQKRPHSSLGSNSVNRKNYNCLYSVRNSSEHRIKENLFVTGSSIILLSKEHVKTKHKDITHRQKIMLLSYKEEKKDDSTHKVNKTVPENCTENIHSGVSRTSIRSKRNPQTEQAQSPSLPFKVEKKVNKCAKRVDFKNRPSLKLAVADITNAVEQIENSSLLKKLPITAFSKKEKEVWEALDKGYVQLTKGNLVRLLAAMENNREAIQRSNDDIQTRSIDHCHIADTHSRKDFSAPSSKSDDSDHLNGIYQKVYQRHLDALTSIIAQDENLTTVASAETLPNDRQKRKGAPRLEIKIAGNSSKQLDQKMRHITQELEELNVLEQLDTRGDETPVITYNHVSTVNKADKFHFTALARRVQEDSRSPSPLLEVPGLSEEISTKRPPL